MKPPELYSACQLFLVPASILFAALGVATREITKTAICFMGAFTSAIWFYRILVWKDLASVD